MFAVFYGVIIMGDDLSWWPVLCVKNMSYDLREREIKVIIKMENGINGTENVDEN